MSQVTINPDLKREREGGSFDPQLMTNLLAGGESNAKRRRYLEHLILSDKAWQGPEYEFLSREERFSEGMRKGAYYHKKIRELGLTDQFDKMIVYATMFPDETHGLDFQEKAFLPAMRMLASDEQLKHWEPLFQNFTILGCYAQTELGHGSNVRALETTATYDPKTEEFIMHTPRLEAAKWWVGNLGKSNPHALVFAQLHSKGQNLGLHTFLVQIRDLKTHQPLPGITVGDIGPKFGFDENDNGFLIMNNYRIPRENMLARLGYIEKDGSYVTGTNPILLFGGMLNLRAAIPMGGSVALAKACTIAIRYSCVRRQSELQPGAPEPQVIDYQTQQYKLFPWLAMAYAYNFAARAVFDQHADIKQDMEQGNFDRLNMIHALSSGLKAHVSRNVMEGVEICRLACGGHGYSNASGIPKIYTCLVPIVTAEGEETVLLLQLARFLVKACVSVKTGDSVDPMLSYLNTEPPFYTGDITPRALLAAYAYRAKMRVVGATTKIERLQKEGKPQHEARNLASVELTKAAEAHMQHFVLTEFIKKVESVPASSPLSKPLHRLLMLYGVHTLLQHAGDLLQSGYLNTSHVTALREREFELLAEIRPDAVTYVDSFDFSDNALHSVLGRFDGNVYEELFKWAQKSTLNKTQVHPSYHKYLKPLRQMSKI